MGDAEEASLPKNTSNGGVLMQAENVLEKLKILNYDTQVVYRKNQTPFTRTYFAEPAANANGQWVSLLSLVSWLVGEVGGDFAVDKYDDPNTSANKMMLTLKKLGFEPDFPVSRLKQAHGEAVCNVLDFLSDKALKKRGFKFRDPAYPETDGFEEAEVDEDADLGQADIIDEAIESEEEDALFSEHVRAGANAASEAHRPGSSGRPAAHQGGGGDSEEDESFAILQGEASSEFQAAWQAELERVAPRLRRAGMAGAGNEWRAHLEQTIKHNTTIQEVLPSCTKQLTRINEDLTTSLERIQTKEAALGGSFEAIAREYKGVQETLKLISQKYETSSETVEKLSNELSTVSEALDELKDNMDSRGNSMVDTSPLQKIRKALSKLKAEIKHMELRIGVVGHSLLQASLRSAQEVRLQKTSRPGAANASSAPRSPRPVDLSPRSPDPAYI